MGISASLLLTAAGAILIWGVDTAVSGLDIHTIGAILMVVGIVGFVISLFFWSSWGGFGTRTVVREREPVVHEETVDRV
jgi:hypothetical protein